jgi:hypothetical protein
MSPGPRAPAPAPAALRARTNRGYITVWVAVLFGLAFTATVVGSAAYIHSTQSLSLASHAQVQAQLKAWSGTEIVREYLAAEQTNGNLAALAAIVNVQNTPLTLTGVSGVSATLVAVNSTTNPTQFTATVTGTTASGTTAQATSTIQAVYSVNNGSGGTTPALNINYNLELGGAVNILQSASSTTQFALNVKGDVTTGGNSITGVSAINSTGTINIGSGSSFKSLSSDCDVVITGSVSVVTVNAQRNICETGAAAVSGIATANGSVSSQAKYTANGTINALASSTASASCSASGYGGSGTIAATCPVPSVTGVDLSAGGAGAANVNSAANVSLGSGGTITKVNAQGNLTAGSGATVSAGVYGGTLTAGSGAVVNATRVSPNTVTLTPAPAISLTGAQFNANTLESYANYAFTLNTNGNAQVTVSNVNGIANGTYYIGNYSGGNYDYLCATPSSTGTSVTVTCGTGSPPSGAFKLCYGNSAYNDCFSYSSGTWKIDSTASVTLPPGIAWFQGNLNLDTGTFYDSFIATGNITTGGSVSVYAANYAGYSGSSGGVTYAPTGICVNSTFTTAYPTQFCTISTTTYNATASSGIGNYAFMAGSYTGTYSAATYVGGNVTIGASSYIYGNIKAGNQYISGGSTTIAGTVTALANSSNVSNSIGGSTTLDYRKIPPTENLNGGAQGTGEGVSASGVSIQWARYL